MTINEFLEQEKQKFNTKDYSKEEIIAYALACFEAKDEHEADSSWGKAIDNYERGVLALKALVPNHNEVLEKLGEKKTTTLTWGVYALWKDELAKPPTEYAYLEQEEDLKRKI